MSGKVYQDASCNAELPAVGDWVAIDTGSDVDEPVIRVRLTRQSCFSRKAPGDTSEQQVIAANVQVVVVVTDAGADFNLRRMERYFTIIAPPAEPNQLSSSTKPIYSQRNTMKMPPKPFANSVPMPTSKSRQQLTKAASRSFRVISNAASR